MRTLSSSVVVGSLSALAVLSLVLVVTLTFLNSVWWVWKFL